VKPRVVGQFRVERGGHKASTADSHDAAVVQAAEHLYAGANFLYNRRSYKHAVKRAALDSPYVQFRFEAIHLAAERIARHDNVQDAEDRLGRAHVT